MIHVGLRSHIKHTLITVAVLGGFAVGGLHVIAAADQRAVVEFEKRKRDAETLARACLEQRRENASHSDLVDMQVAIFTSGTARCPDPERVRQVRNSVRDRRSGQALLALIAP